jgi:UDP-N-acetyl-D-glucosamine dehydrogenase
MYEKLRERIEKKEASIIIVGLGYVGLPLAVEFAKVGFKVIGVDLMEKKVRDINDGASYIPDVPTEEIRSLREKGLISATTDFSIVRDGDAILICVPTPLSKTKDPDMGFVIQAVEASLPYLRKGHILTLESTVYPGATEELVKPMLEAKGLKVGEDVFLAFSPERINPGDPVYGAKNTPKVVGGVTSRCTEIVCALYSKAIDEVVPVSSAKAAEMVKLLENTFRSVNIGLVNEMAIMCNILDVDVWEVIEAASTKPFGFMRFFPGPGIGGHCIPIDPHYLSWKMKTLNYNAKFIELASEINTNMPRYVIRRVADILNEDAKSIRGTKILVLGVAYKEDIDDLRESPAIDIIELLEAKGAQVVYNDPFIPEAKFNDIPRTSVEITDELLKSVDAVLVITGHSSYDYDRILSHAKLVMDTRNATRNVRPELRENIVKL